MLSAFDFATLALEEQLQVYYFSFSVSERSCFLSLQILCDRHRNYVSLHIFLDKYIIPLHGFDLEHKVDDDGSTHTASSVCP